MKNLIFDEQLINQPNANGATNSSSGNGHLDGLTVSMLNASASGMATLDADRRIVFANSAFTNIAATESSVIGQRVGEMVQCKNANLASGGCGTSEFCSQCGALKAMLIAGQGQRNQQECRIIRYKNGVMEALDLRVTAEPLFIEQKKFILFTVIDITNEKRRVQLEHIFFHDIANTVGIIYGISELMTHAEQQTPECISLLGQASQRLLEEIEAQRQITAAENGDLIVTREPVVTLDVIQQMADFYATHGLAKNRIIRVDPVSEHFVLQSDAALLRRVIGNMTKNALEASQPGEKVSLGSYRDGAEIIFWVHNANFIPRSSQLQIFQRSFSTKGAGRGLGTYSIKMLTEQYLNGRVWFISKQPEGTTFFAAFPAEQIS